MSNYVFATAPCCWGIEDEDNPYKMPWKSVFKEIRTAGITVSEAGPYNYVPVGSQESLDYLKEIGVSVIAGTLLGDLVNESAYPDMCDRAEKICSMLEAFPEEPILGKKKGKYLVLIDFAHDGREETAGRSEEAVRLTPEKKKALYDHIRHFSEIAKSHGIRAVLHNHCGGCVEFEDEVDDLLANIPQEVAGICFDTGHFLYAGMNPAASIRRFGKRIDYMHFKDIDGKKFEECKKNRVPFRESSLQGVFTPVGYGSVDYDDVLQALEDIGYEGYIVLEEDKDPKNSNTSMNDVKQSLAFVKSKVK